MRVAHRVRQFFHALKVRDDPTLPLVLRAYLNPAEESLFLRQSPTDQRHAVMVFKRLRVEGGNSSVLLRAALLHDVGKTVGVIRLWHRVVYVLLSRAIPSLLELITNESDGWRQPFWVLKRHAALGAALAREIGVEPAVVELIANHHRPLHCATMNIENLDLLAKLQKADEEI